MTNTEPAFSGYEPEIRLIEQHGHSMLVGDRVVTTNKHWRVNGKVFYHEPTEQEINEAYKMTDDVALLPDEIYAWTVPSGFKAWSNEPRVKGQSTKYVRADRPQPEPVAVDVDRLRRKIPYRS